MAGSYHTIFNPASIFLGDTGSMFIGFSFATLIAMMAEQRPKWFLAALVMFALPVLDTVLAFVRRWVNKRRSFPPTAITSTTSWSPAVSRSARRC